MWQLFLRTTRPTTNDQMCCSTIINFFPRVLYFKIALITKNKVYNNYSRPKRRNTLLINKKSNFSFQKKTQISFRILDSIRAVKSARFSRFSIFYRLQYFHVGNPNYKPSLQFWQKNNTHYCCISLPYNMYLILFSVN